MAAGVRLRPLAATILAAPAGPADPVKLRVGNSAAPALAFVPVEAGGRERCVAGNGVAVTRSRIPQSVADLCRLDTTPDMSKLDTEAYLPK